MVLKDLADRRLDTEIGRFDMVTAVTQNAINREFEMLYRAEPSLQAIEIIDEDINAELHAKIDYPMARFIATSNETIIFCLSLKSGVFKYRHNHKPVETLIKDWVLAFRVNIREEVSPNPPERVTKAIESKGLGKPGDYSIQQLLVDFTTAQYDNYDKTLTKLPGMDMANAYSIFETMIHQWIEDSKLGTGHIIAYIPKLKPDRPVKPTLVPQQMKYQSYPFKAANVAEDDDGGNNMLLYLEMTEKHTMPTGSLDKSDNWVIPGAGGKSIDGCVALSRSVFLEELLVKRFQVFNENTFVIPTHAELHDLAIPSWEWGRTGGSGYDYSFKYGGRSGDMLTWTFEPKLPTKEDWGPLRARKVQVRSGVKNYVHVPIAPQDGICRITVGGNSWANLQTNIVGNNVEATSEVTWSVDFIFKSIESEGKLVIIEPTIVDPPVVLSKYDSWFGTLDKARQETIKNAVASPLSAISISDTANYLNKMFSGTWAFYFGQANDFFLKNPVFNREGDFLVELQYQGV